MDIFDTHAHYDSKDYDLDRDELLNAMALNGVKFIINQGIDIASSKASIALAKKHTHVYAAVGIHPEEIEKMESVNEIEKLACEKKVVAIGEIGLDYYYNADTKDLQLDYFRKQLHLANKLNLPVVIHNREAHKDTLETLKEIPMVASGSIHCYSGSVEMAKELLNMGFYLGFDGPITFKNARIAIDVLKYMPLDRILVETDAPYLTPVPFRGKRNNSMYLEHVINKIAEIKSLSPQEVSQITMENAKKLFHIDN